VFVELPRTGSTTISRELRTHYDGVRIKPKHGTYYEFLKVANRDEKQYFVFSCIRNPLDETVSRYFKLKTNHKERYTNRAKRRKRRGIGERIETLFFHYVEKSGADFPTFLRTFYVLPYSNWAMLSHKTFNFVIRFENLLEQKRPLSVMNKTNTRASDFTQYYTPATTKRAKRVFGPFMKEWGYEFPTAWGKPHVPWWNQIEFTFFNFFWKLYWKHLKYRI
jgi:hypothetical protein